MFSIILTILCVLLFKLLFYLIEDNLKKFSYNGKLIYNFLESGSNENNFSEMTIEECNSKENDYMWKHFADNDNENNILKNSSPELGYCLRFDSAKIEDIVCNEDNGGVKILRRTNDGKFAYFCLCKKPHIYVNDPETGDCTHYNGCRTNGKMMDGNCVCNDGYFKSTNELGVENCKPRSIFKDSNMLNILDRKFVDPNYLALIDETVNLPNPCNIDIVSGRLYENVGMIKTTDDGSIVYCDVQDPRFVTIQVNDDYLKGNGGKYANAIFKYSNASSTEIIYETSKFTKHGFRLKYNDFFYKLPYMELDSGNMGGSGRDYEPFPRATENEFITNLALNNRKIYIYNAKTPEKIEPKIGSFVKFSLFFTIASVIEQTQRNYHGQLATINNNSTNTNVFWEPNYKRYKNIKDSSILFTGRIDYHTNDVRRWVTSNPFNSGSFNFYSNYSSGIYMTYKKQNDIFSKAISPHSKILVNRFKSYVDADYRSKDAIKFDVNTHDQGTFLTDKHMWPEDSFTYDRSAICTPPLELCHIDPNGEFKIPEYY